MPIMTDYAQIINHTPEQTLQWKEIVISNPGRVARTLVLQPGRTTREGDNQGDIYPALQAIMEIIKQGRGGVENKAWENLVSGGIADALCKNVCEMAVTIQVLPTMPAHLLEKVKNEVRSPYYAPLEILCFAAVNFQYPPTKTDKKVIAALRKNWSEMMERIWNEPENTLRPEDSHTLERMVVAQMVLRLMITDPTFISILYEPSDLTIQIIARHWKYAQRPPDAAITASTLYLMLEPDHPRQVMYVRSNGLESATSQLVSKILIGVGPTALSSKQQQAKALIAAFAEHLVRLTGRSAGDELEFLMGIIAAAKKDGSEPEVAKVVLKSTPLWNAMFRLLKKAAKPMLENDREPGALQDPETEKNNRRRIISNIVGTSANTLHNAKFEHPRECEPLVRIWANENIFGALEETIELLVTMPGMTMQLTRLVSTIESTISEGTPPLLRLYHTQFPRWRILGTLVKHDIERQQVLGPPPAPIPSVVAPRDSGLWDHGVWQCFGSLQVKCMDKKMCGKRGCENENNGNIVCQCQAVKYCSEACKTKDWKDHGHRLACGFMGLLDVEGRGDTRQAASPPTTQKMKGKKKKTQAPKRDSPPPTGSQTRLEDLD